MAELYTAARAASRVRETPASILFRIGVIFAVLFSLTFTAPAGTAIAQNASADQPTKKGSPGKSRTIRLHAGLPLPQRPPGDSSSKNRIPPAGCSSAPQPGISRASHPQNCPLPSAAPRKK